MLKYSTGIFSTLCLALLLATTACQSAPPQHTPAHSALTDADLTNPWATQQPAAQPQPAAAAPMTVDQALGSDPCSVRLANLEGALVMYYAVNHQLPAQLHDLRTETGEMMEITCPTSNRPYQYSAQGLFSAGRTMRIIVWDDAPVHNGYRWCIFMSPAKPGQLALDVKPIPEALFKMYAPPVN